MLYYIRLPLNFTNQIFSEQESYVEFHGNNVTLVLNGTFDKYLHQ